MQNDGAGSSVVTAVCAVFANDVWAVGFYDDGSTFRTLAEHWDGSLWSVVPTPNVGDGENALTAVATVSASDVWAVGYDSPDVPRRTLAERWDGSSWSVVPTQNV